MELRLNFKEEKGSQKGKADILKAMSFLVLLGTRPLNPYMHAPCVTRKGELYGTEKNTHSYLSTLLTSSIEQLFLKCFLLSEHLKKLSPTFQSPLSLLRSHLQLF